MDSECPWFTLDEEEDRMRPRLIDREDSIRPWDNNNIVAPYQRDNHAEKRQFRSRVVKDEPCRASKTTQRVNQNLINDLKFKDILQSTNRTTEQAKLSPTSEKTRQMREMLRLHRSSQCQNIRHMRKRNPKVAYESVKCREFRAEESDLPVRGQSIRYDPWIRNRNRFISSTSPVAAGIPEHVKHMFEKPKTRAGGASMNTRYSAVRHIKPSKTEPAQPDSQINICMRITGRRLSSDQTERKMFKTSYDSFY